MTSPKVAAKTYEMINRISSMQQLDLFDNSDLEGLARWESQRNAPVVKETVNHPDHYNQGKFEVIDVIEDWNLGFEAGNAVKYIARYKHKAKPVEDLKKARWYIDRLIQRVERENG